MIEVSLRGVKICFKTNDFEKLLLHQDKGLRGLENGRENRAL